MKEIPMKTTMRYHYMPIKWLQLERPAIPSLVSLWRKLYSHTLWVRKLNSTTTLETSLAASFKIRHIPARLTRHPSPR